MAQKIIVEPRDLWSYYLVHKKQLTSTMFEIAQNKEYGVSIYLSENEKGNASIVVEADDIEVYSETIVSDRDARKTCEKIYDKYLSDKVVDILAEMGIDDDMTALEQEDAIAEREAQLDGAVVMFLGDVMDGDEYADYYMDDEMLEDIKDHFLEYLARKHCLPVRRPMILEDEDGEDFFEEYPYECMVFDDEDNPIYQ